MSAIKNLPYLQAGDTVDIIAPAARCQPAVLEKVKKMLQAWGLQCHIPKDIFGKDLHCANTEDKRFKQLQAALLSKKSKAIWCLRGGYGATKLIPMLEMIKSPQQAKIFIGFSDITALHIFLQEKWGWATIHGPSARQAAMKEVSMASIKNLKKIIFRETNSLTYGYLKPLNNAAKKNKLIKAPLTGGNLTLIQTSLATAWQINTKDKILLLEEVNERAYRIDRMLAHLDQAGIIRSAKAIILGDFTDGNEPNGKSHIKATLKNFAANCQVPVLQMTGVGHGKTNHPIILGQLAQLHLGANSSLTFRV